MTVLYDFINIKTNTAHDIYFIEQLFLVTSQLFLIIYGIYLLINDYNVCSERHVFLLPYIKSILILTVYMSILTVFHSGLLSSYNYLIFIIHSILFFLVLLIYGDRFRWIESMVKIALLLTMIISIISILSFFVFVITHSKLLNLFGDSILKTYLLKISPTDGRLNSIFNNPNYFAYLLLYSFYIYLFLILYYKTTKLKYFLSIGLLFNLINLFLAGSRGAIITLIVSSVLFSLIFLLLMKKTHYSKLKFFTVLILSIYLFLILFFLIIYNTNFRFSQNVRAYILSNIFRLDNLADGKKRIELAEVILSLDIKYLLFGISDSKIILLLKDGL